MMKVDIENIKKTFAQFTKKNKTAVILLVMGVILIMLSGTEKGDDNNEKDMGDSGAWITSYSLEETEKKLSEILKGISGVGRVEVMLTLKTGVERVLAQNESTSKYTLGEEENSEKREEKDISVVIVDTEGNEETVTVKYIFPEYLGALIVAEGADNASVRLAITQAVTSVTGLPIGNITVLNMNK